MTALYIIAGCAVLGVGWSVWIYTRGTTSAEAKDDLEEERHAREKQDEFRSGLKGARRTVRDWFYRGRRL